MGIYVVNGLVLLGLVAIALSFLLRDGEEGGGEGRPAAGSSASQDSGSVRIRIVGVPDGADVRFDGRSVGTDFEVPSARDEHAVEVTVPGRPSVLRMVRPTADLTLDLGSEFSAGDSG